MKRQDDLSLEIFRGLSRQHLDELYGMMELCRFSKNEKIFEQGQKAKYLYILLSGEVSVDYKPYDAPLLTVARISPGNVFGWSAALGREIYTSGATAIEAGEAFRLSISQLRLICDGNPEVGAILLDRLASGIAERLKNTHSQVLTLLSQGIDLDSECDRKGVNNG